MATTTKKTNNGWAEANIFAKFMQRTYNFNKSEAWSYAWLIRRVRKALASGITEFYYRKKDGTIRKAIGTTKADLIAETLVGNTERNDSLKVLTYFDIEKNGWRSCQLQALLKPEEALTELANA